MMLIQSNCVNTCFGLSRAATYKPVESNAIHVPASNGIQGMKWPILNASLITNKDKYGTGIYNAITNPPLIWNFVTIQHFLMSCGIWLHPIYLLLTCFVWVKPVKLSTPCAPPTMFGEFNVVGMAQPIHIHPCSHT
ncbi:hypothetical protein BATDEDRAFT_92003 [Batrachochytrium dendrobatidis JAM81]|uniref:Uncharacterized protein n=1 Tax=Batrachochytrium dendrobatidis (strain JAM81 / FGSC 10211) TaxID=684364 RepID=F4PCG2_BATDJ|nr:uncharacterized protein BATDEDRAFT_92003 [Batrachochytrium dendrobatidis JAM81]EGF77193.1 hypothetical protein BATDEDRAFT_92003 [Batrachochytrium dendrobatidis JAM81]|eukprot:XP_006682307.1 hypothetical protein BATDEDRAFT_92003 [Batrachochytrium dendrobatidis JAM81]